MLGEQDIEKVYYDDEGNIIEIIEPDNLDEVPDYPNSYYESEGAKYINTQISIENTIVNLKEEFDTVKDELVNLLESVLKEGKMTKDDSYLIKELTEKTATTYSALNDILATENQNSIQEQLDEIKADMITATPDGILDVLTEGGTKSWLYKDNNGNILIDMQSIPQLTVLLKELFLIAADEEGESEFHLTPKLIELISNTITLTAERINLNGYISGNGGNFSIDEQGNIEANDLNVRGTLTCKDINVTNIISPTAPEAIESNLNIYIQSGDTITNHLDTIPINLNGYSINIYLGTLASCVGGVKSEVHKALSEILKSSTNPLKLFPVRSSPINTSGELNKLTLVLSCSTFFTPFTNAYNNEELLTKAK